MIRNGNGPEIEPRGGELFGRAARERFAGAPANRQREHQPGDGRQRGADGIERYGEGGDAALTDPRGREWNEREREEEAEVGPQDAVTDLIEFVHHIVVVYT